MTAIGFIGLGHMGNPMVKNLIKAGHSLTVYDVVSESVIALEKSGAKSAANLAELAANAEVIITMLQTGEQVEKVCAAADGLFAHAKKGTLFIDSSSIDVSAARRLNQQATALGFTMIDAPVSGGVKGAEEARLTVMVGGTKQALNQAQPYLACYGKTIVHAGPAGNGQVAKICNNMILGISMIGISEAYTLGEKLGLPAEKLFEISSKASGQCWSMTSYSPVPGIMENVPSNNDYKPGFTAKMMQKDLRLSQQAAQSVGTATPLGAEALALYTLFVNQGMGDLDFSGIIKML